jgi:hypothetical protein
MMKSHRVIYSGLVRVSIPQELSLRLPMSLPLTSIHRRVSSNHAFLPLTKAECPCRTLPSTADNLVTADDVFVAVSPVRVDAVGPRDALGVASVPGVLCGLYFSIAVWR